ncbi:phosphotransferase [Jidongwangia harbinensis]|uniref:phosphotransferase n=1 Tax=Jidongwangia harbinensis TaxID=2878561 RepID=UPI001CD9C004|nr:phosphotransferase [Jidongwangia harbinensis]MCA2218703.1 phosphotransferase [Jidongwangia harbinensis]
MDDRAGAGGFPRPARPVRVGDTVRRPSHHRSAYVDALLRQLAEHGFAGAPRPLGYDGHGRQILTYIEGEVPDGEGPYLLTDARIRSAAALIRAFHDATVRSPLRAGGEVVCHGDLGPHNTVFRGAQAVAIIDFEDDVGPGRRVDDFAQAVWGFADLTEPAVALTEQARKTRLMCDVYGGITPAAVVASLTERFRRARDEHHAAGLRGAVLVFDDLLTWAARYGPEIAGG